MEEETPKARQRKVRLISGLFIGLLIVFTLAGNTLQALTLAKVVTTQVTEGAITHSFEGSATVNPKEKRELTNPAGWKVDKVFVKEGDVVHKGQILVQYDSSDFKQQVASAEISLKKQTMSMEEMKFAIIDAMKGNDEAAKLSATTRFESAKLDLTKMQQDLQASQKKLADNEQIVAPFDGIVTTVGAVEGLNSSGGPDIRISNSTKGYQIELLIPSDIGSVLNEGESLDSITLIGKGKVPVAGKIEKIEAASDSAGGSSMNVNENASASGPKYRLVIAIEDKELHGGERVQVKITRADSNDQILVPNKAVHKEMDKAYVYTLEERQSPLGNSYYVRRIPIQISESSDSVIAVSEGLFNQQEVIVDSDGLIMDGTRVRK